jgi:hypothetical protein
MSPNTIPFTFSQGKGAKKQSCMRDPKLCCPIQLDLQEQQSNSPLQLRNFEYKTLYHVSRVLSEMCEVQQNSFNLESDNSEILIIRHLSSVVPSFALYQQKALSLEQADLTDMF